MYEERLSPENSQKTGHPAEDVTLEMMNFTDAEMAKNDEMTAPQLTKRVNECFEKQFSQDKIKRLRRNLGWVCTATKYCQLICVPNRVKRQEFCEKCLQDNKQFDDVYSMMSVPFSLKTTAKSVFIENGSSPS